MSKFAANLKNDKEVQILSDFNGGNSVPES